MMEQNKPWKLYNDEWNFQNYELDHKNKLKYATEFVKNDAVVCEEPKEDSNDNKYNRFQFQETISLETMRNIISVCDYKNNTSSGKIFTDLIILDNIIKVIGWCSNNTHNIDDVLLHSKGDNLTSESSTHRFMDNSEESLTIDFINAIKWICSSIEYFMTELKVPKITNKQYNGLIRSSYKLCPNKANCIYQYPDNNSHNTCKFQHFPYDNLFLDCNSILQYVNESSKYENKNENENEEKSVNTQYSSNTSRLIMAINNKKNNPNDSDNMYAKSSSNELKRCLTTLNYVFIIMFRELETIDRVRKSEPNYNIRKYHSYHIPFKYENRVEYTNSNSNDRNRTSWNSNRGRGRSYSYATSGGGRGSTRNF